MKNAIRYPTYTTAYSCVTAPDSKGRRHGILGKAFAIASAVALSLPLLGLGQVAGVVPGGFDSAHYHNIAELGAIFNRPAYTQVDDSIGVLHPVDGKIHESFYGNPYDWRTNNFGDSAVGPIGVIGGFAGAGVLGAVGSAFAESSQKRKGGSTQEALSVAGQSLQAIGDGMRPFMPLFAFDAIRGKSSDVSKGIAMAAAIGIVAVGTALPTYLSGKSVYDNFIRPESRAPRPNA